MPDLRHGRGKWDEAPCILTQPFYAPRKLDLTGEPQDSLLLRRLPLELLLQIFGHAGPVDGFALAMSCKELLSVAMLAKLRVPELMAHRAPWGAHILWPWDTSNLNSMKPLCQCGGLESILRRFRPKTANGRNDRSYHLCIDCLKWLPRRKSFWRAELKVLRNERWDDEVQDDWNHAAKHFNKGIKMQCPPCRIKEYGNCIVDGHIGPDTLPLVFKI